MTDQLTSAQVADLARTAQFFKQWIILSPGDGIVPVRPEDRYVVKNRTNRHFLRYKDQGFAGGINLGFTKNAEPSTARRVMHWQFRNYDGTSVRYDQPIALRCKNRYLRYGARPVGINLKWSRVPVFEWRLLGGGRPGEVVETNEWLALVNILKMWPLIHFKRLRGGDIGWPTTMTIAGQLRRFANETAQRAVVEYLKTRGGRS